MLSDELEKLKNLHAEGALTDEEFEAAKGQLIKTDRVHEKSADLLGLDLPNYLALMHASQFANLLLPPAGWVIPIILWSIAKDKYPEIEIEGKHIINWMISEMIYLVGGFMACLTLIGIIIGLPVLFLVIIAGLILPLIGLVEATQGRSYKYPMAIEFIK
jgi:uncharacterized protein